MSVLLIFGSRHFEGRPFLFRTADRARRRLLEIGDPVECVVSGTARGADQLGEAWARSVGIEVRRFPALWHLHGKAAGPKRNQQMLDEGGVTHAIGFMFPASRGTADMWRRLQASRVKGWLAEFDWQGDVAFRTCNCSTW